MAKNLNIEMERASKNQQWADAAVLAEQVCVQYPKHSRAWLILGVSRFHLSNLTQAQAAIEKSLALNSTQPEAYFWLARILSNKQEPLQADIFFSKAIELDQTNPQYPIFKAVNLYNNHLFIEIKKDLPSLVRKYRENPIFPIILMAAFEETKQEIDLDIETLKVITGAAENSEDENIHFRYINILAIQDKKENLSRFLTNNKVAKHLLIYGKGKIFELEDNIEQAEIHYQEAFKIKKTDFLCRRLSEILFEQNKFEECTSVIKAFLEENPNDPQGLIQLGMIYYALPKEQEKAIVCFEKAIEAKPDLDMAKWNMAHPLFNLGRVKEGWDKHRYRESLFLPRKFHAEIWKENESLKNKTLMVWSEQGVGDYFMFANCFPDLVKKSGAKHIIYETDPRLLALMQRSFLEIDVRQSPRLQKDGAPYITDYTHHIPMGTLPVFYRKQVNAFPTGSYLKTNPEWDEEWKKRLDHSKKNIGICWRSGVRSTFRDRYLTDIEVWGPLFSIPNVNWINLQYGDCDKELEFAAKHFGVKIQSWSDINLKDDFDAVASLIKSLDLVITAPTAVMQLAGAVTGGKNVWPFITHPNWSLLGQNYSPWFPEARVYRTEVPTPIHHTFPRMSEDLRKWLQGENMPAGVVMCEEQDESLFTTHTSERYSDALSCEEKLARGDITTIQAIEATFSQSLIKRLNTLSEYKQVEPLEEEVLKYGGTLANYIQKKINQPILEKELLIKGTGKKTLLIFFQGNINMALPQSEVTPYLTPKFAGVRLFEEILQDYPDTCYLGVRDSWQMWYQVGPLGTALADQGLSAQQRWLSLLNAKIEKSGCQKIICLGTSAGASAAIQFGAKLDAKAVLAISPQAKPLDNEWENKKGQVSFMVTRDVQWRKKVKEQFNIPALDLKPYAEELGSRLQLFVPKLYEADLIHANYLANTNPNIQVHRSPGKDHADVSKALFKKALIEQIIK
ncbi:tetratricopeptide repeat protein [Aquaspirillum soli]